MVPTGSKSFNKVPTSHRSQSITNLKKEDNPWLSKAPKRNKIIEMLLQSTPMRVLEKDFATLPAAGTVNDYSNKVEIDKRSNKKHFNFQGKDLAPRLIQPGGIDVCLFNNL